MFGAISQINRCSYSIQKAKIRPHLSMYPYVKAAASLKISQGLSRAAFARLNNSKKHQA